MSILFSLDIHHHHHDTCIYIIYIYIYELFIYSPSCLSYKMGGFVPLVLTLFPLKFEGGYIYMYILSLFFLLYIYRDIYTHVYIYVIFPSGSTYPSATRPMPVLASPIEWSAKISRRPCAWWRHPRTAPGPGMSWGLGQKTSGILIFWGINIYEPGFFAN